MTKGWHRQSREHSLAARGIKTRVSRIGQTHRLHRDLNFKDIDYLRGQTGKTINAYKDGQHVATASYYYMPGNMELAILGVDKSHQSEGIGSKMVDLIIQKQERLGARLWVKAEADPKKRIALVKFYESKGFRKVRQLPTGAWLMVRLPSRRMPTGVYNRVDSSDDTYTFIETPMK